MLRKCQRNRTCASVTRDDLFDQRVAERIHGVIDEDAAVVERNDVDAGGKARLDLVDLLFDAAITSRALAP